MAQLNALPPTLEPHATHNIDAMIELTRTLIEKEHAYESEGHVLFAVESMEDYGKLSNRSLDDMLAAFADDYQGKGLSIVGISSNDVENYPQDGPQEMKAEAQSAGYHFVSVRSRSVGRPQLSSSMHARLFPV